VTKSLKTGLAVSTEYRRVTDGRADEQTDGQTDILRRHSPRYALWQAELVFIHNCRYRQLKLPISLIRITDIGNSVKLPISVIRIVSRMSRCSKCRPFALHIHTAVFATGQWICR